jgi:hypothetical protein
MGLSGYHRVCLDVIKMGRRLLDLVGLVGIWSALVGLVGERERERDRERERETERERQGEKQRESE